MFGTYRVRLDSHDGDIVIVDTNGLDAMAASRQLRQMGEAPEKCPVELAYLTVVRAVARALYGSDQSTWPALDDIGMRITETVQVSNGQVLPLQTPGGES